MNNHRRTTQSPGHHTAATLQHLGLATTLSIALAALMTAAVGCSSPSATPDAPSSASASQPAAARADALKGQALRDALEGKTHKGIIMGKDFRAYFAPNGDVEADVAGDKLVGHWEIETQDTFCIQWVTPPIPRGCSWIVLTEPDSGGTYKVDDGSLRNTVQILSGRQL